MIAKDMGMIAVGITVTPIVLVLPLLSFKIAEIIMSRIGKKESGLPIFECPPPPPPKYRTVREKENERNLRSMDDAKNKILEQYN